MTVRIFFYHPSIFHSAAKDSDLFRQVANFPSVANAKKVVPGYPKMGYAGVISGHYRGLWGLRCPNIRDTQTQ